MRRIGRSARRAAILALALGALAACATPTPSASVQQQTYADRLPARAEVAEVPFHPQAENQCGPAALAMAMGWSGLPVAPDDLAGQVLTPEREGTLSHDLVAAARRAGRLAVPVQGMDQLLAELAAGHPVAVLQNLGLDWYPQWHYAVAIGYDLEADTLLLHSGEEARQVMALATFKRTWQRADQWALSVLPPDSLPAAADEGVVLAAAVGLEQAGRHEAAASAYGAALERWPDSIAALIGLGNARYAAGQLSGAEAAFRTAVSFHPEKAAAWNNLAHVLAEQGELAEALAAAKRAVDLGGDDAATYRATLQEISASI
jgi:tetratricopeptide (TPR) repeat protein